MSSLPKQLELFLRGAARIAVMAVGSDLRADDAAGLLVARELSKRLRRIKNRLPVKVFEGYTAPENLTGEVKRFKPTHLIVVDSIDFGKRAGTVGLVETSQIRQTSFGTHQMPMDIWVAYFREAIACRVIILGIQPKQMSFMGGVTPAVRLASIKLQEMIVRSLPKKAGKD